MQIIAVHMSEHKSSGYDGWLSYIFLYSLVLVHSHSVPQCATVCHSMPQDDGNDGNDLISFQRLTTQTVFVEVSERMPRLSGYD